MAATPTASVLSPNATALLCQNYRSNLLKAMNADCFTGAERHRAMKAYQACTDPETLHTWLKQVRHVQQYREQNQPA